jgi:hypothetical protein
MQNVNQIRFTDKVLTCQDCGQTFTWSASEQRYYFSKRLSPPKRCIPCREQRKATIIPDSEVQHGL